MTGDDGVALVSRRTLLKTVGVAVAAAAITGPASSAAAPPTPSPAPTAPPDPEIAAMAESLDYDVEGILRFVADEIRYEPYAGLLRGANGTLAARAGNSVDQALLLRSLLTASALDTRIMVGPLPGSLVNAILTSSVGDAATDIAHSADVLWGPPENTSTPAPAPAQSPAGAALRAGFAAADDVAVFARSEASRLVEALGATIASVGSALPASTSTMPELERTQHLWIQVAQGAEWTDLDPTLPGVLQGTALATSAAVLPAIPDALRHRLDFSLRDESVSAGKLVIDVGASVSTFADLLIGKPVTVLNTRPGGLPALGSFMTNALAGTVQYVPVIAIGDQATVGRRAMTFGAVGDVFAAPSAGTLADGETTAQWLEISVLPPDGSADVVRRTIFDRIGEDARATGSIRLADVRSATFTDLGDGADKEYLPALTSYSISVAGGAVGASTFRDIRTGDDLLSATGAMALLYHVIREAASSGIGVDMGIRDFYTGPNLTAIVLRASPPGASGGVLDVGIDVLSRAHGWAPVRTSASSPAPGLLSGVLDQVTERLLAGETGGSEPSAAADLTASSVLDEADRQGIPVLILRDVGDLAAMTLPPGITARLHDRLARPGVFVIVPQRPVSFADGPRLAWWVGDMGSGLLWDELDDGSGGDLGEDVAIDEADVKAMRPFYRSGKCVAAVAFTVARLFGELYGQYGDPPAGVSKVLGATKWMLPGGPAAVVAGCKG